MIWLLGGYMWLYVHRPFEFISILGTLQFERAYMMLMLVAWAVTPDKGFAVNRLHVAVLFFTFALFGAWLLSPYNTVPACYDVVENYVKVTVFYVLVVTTVRDERSFRLLLLLFIIANAVYMSHSFLEFLRGKYQWRMGTRRMVGVDLTYADPNAFASTLLYTLPFVLPFWHERPRRVPTFLMLCYIAGVLLCILLTGSRAGFAGLTFLCLILFVFCAKNRLQAVLITGVLGMFGLIVLSAALPEDLQNRYLTLIDSTRGPANAQTSADGRIEGFLAGITVWQRSPLVGYGPASFAMSTGRGGQAHNLYGQVLSELGILGAIGLLGLVVCFLLNRIEVGRMTAELGAPPNAFLFQASRAIGINIVLLLFMGWSGHNMFRYNWQWLAAFSVAGVWCMRQQVIRASEQAWYGPAIVEEDPAPLPCHA